MFSLRNQVCAYIGAVCIGSFEVFLKLLFLLAQLFHLEVFNILIHPLLDVTDLLDIMEIQISIVLQKLAALHPDL